MALVSYLSEVVVLKSTSSKQLKKGYVVVLSVDISTSLLLLLQKQILVIWVTQTSSFQWVGSPITVTPTAARLSVAGTTADTE